MTDRPIIFSGAMVTAILDGRKTQTRRVLKRAADGQFGEMWPAYVNAKRIGAISGNPAIEKIPAADGGVIWAGPTFYVPGDRLWVREAWRAGACADGLKPKELSPRFWKIDNGGLWYEADCTAPFRPISPRGRYRHARFMPRWASRITLIVEDVRVQRVQEISERDAEAEGIKPILVPPDGGGSPHTEGFSQLWNSLHTKKGSTWDDNPWVAAITFRPVFQNIDKGN